MTREIKYFSGSTNFRTSTIKESTFATLVNPDVVHDTTEMSSLSSAQMIVSDNAGKVLAMPTGSSRNYLYSTDYGYTFTPLQFPAAIAVSAAIYAGGQWVVLPTSGTTAYTSPDGITWTTRTLATNQSWAAIAYTAGIYVATAFSTTTSNTSPDGITWTQRALPQGTANNRYNIAGANGTFVYCSNNTNVAYYSTDGITWNSSAPALGSVPTVVGYIAGNFVIFGTSTSSFGFSATGTSWSINSLATSFTGGAIASGGGHLIAFSSSGQAYYTDNASTMTLVHNGNEVAFSTTSGVYACYDGQKSVLRTDANNAGVLYRMVQSKYGGFNTSNVLPVSTTWYNIAWGGSLGIWVAIAGTGTQAASATNILGSWTSRTLPSSQAWRHIAFGASTFVIGNPNNSTGAYSTNGTTWTGMTITGCTPNGMVYGDKFVAVGSGASTSTDGITWTSRTIGITAQAVAYGNGLYVAVASSTASTSPDGITWTTRAFPLANANSVAYGNGIWIATTTSSNQYTTSYDGINWAPVQSYPQSWNGQAARIQFINDRFILPGSSTNTYMVTADGMNFQLHKNGLSTTISSALFASDGTTFAMMPTGLTTTTLYTWNEKGTMTANAQYYLHESRFGSANYESAQYVNNRYVLGSCLSSDGGYSWGLVDVWGAQTVMRKIAYSGSAYVGINSSGQLYYSADAQNWARINTVSTMSTPSAVTWDGSKFIALSSSGTVAATSTNGKTWTAITQIAGQWGTLATNGTNLYVAFQSTTPSATYMTSTDGTTWTSRTFPNTTNLYHRSVVYVDGSFFVMSAEAPTTTSGVIFKSDDGLNWTAVELPSIGVWISQYSANDALWMVNQRGLVVVTYDKGVTWKIVADLNLSTTTTTILSMAVSSNGGEMLLIGTSGYIARLRLGQTAIYTVPAGRSSKVTFNYLKNTQANLNFMMDTVPVFSATSVNTEAGTTVTDKPIYMGPGSQILANVDMDYSFLAIEEY